MENIFRRVYVMLHVAPDESIVEMGEAHSVADLQVLYDTLNEALVLSVIDALKRGATTPVIPKTKLRIKYCDKNGRYIPNAPQEANATLTNVHDDFFRYFQAHKRSLYSDRALNQEMANMLLKALKEEQIIRNQIRTNEHEWFKVQVATAKANGLPVIISAFPKSTSHDNLDALLTGAQQALQGLQSLSTPTPVGVRQYQ